MTERTDHDTCVPDATVAEEPSIEGYVEAVAEFNAASAKKFGLPPDRMIITGAGNEC